MGNDKVSHGVEPWGEEWLGLRVSACDGDVVGVVVGVFTEGPLAGRVRVEGEHAPGRNTRGLQRGRAVYAIPRRAVGAPAAALPGARRVPAHSPEPLAHAFPAAVTARTSTLPARTYSVPVHQGVGALVLVCETFIGVIRRIVSGL